MINQDEYNKAVQDDLKMLRDRLFAVRCLMFVFYIHMLVSILTLSWLLHHVK